MRIVAGRFRGRALAAPGDMRVRPTLDRVRESVFNILLHGIEGFVLDGARVIDLFAGTGALGIEAVSRGASYCLFVEDAAEARALIRQNVEAFGLTGETRIFRRDATDLGPAGNMGPYDLAFLDPPYDKGLGEKGLAGLAQGGWLKPGAICVLEERAGTDVALPAEFALLDTRTYGETVVRFLRFR
ncbi:MAG TPA: 16S rRNA (guanine(966)-N(2))-methyltransferase RsmD [Hyphomicrobium sp.]|jgi:16S rRNA (guanine966-N2)-methyltransferase